MTLGEFLDIKRKFGEEIDIEVDGYGAICYSGTELTEEGKYRFEKALSLPMYEDDDGKVYPCAISYNDEDYEEDNEESALRLAWTMVLSMAGYCSCSDFKMWFKE